MLLPLFRSLCFRYCIAHGVISVRACFVDCCLLNKVSFFIEHFIYLRHSRCDKLIMINLKKGTRTLMEKTQQWLDRSVNRAPDSLNCLKIPTIINHQIFLRAYDWSKGISRSNKTNKNKIINNWEDAGNFEKLRFFKIRLCTRILKSSLQGGRAFFFFFFFLSS